MKNILKYFIVGGAAMTMLSSCDLNLLPTTSIAYEEGSELFLNENDVAAFQNGVMASYRALQYGVYTQTTEVQCDGFNATIDYGNNYGAIHRCDQTLTPGDYDTEAMWENHYVAIKNYNIAIANADNVSEDLKASASVLKGIALFCRASSYLTLTRHFGNAYNPSSASTDLSVPLVLKYDQLEKPARATVKAVYDQIITDLEEAEVLLANVPGKVRAQLPTVDAVRALKARYYLDIHEYEDAADYAEQVINSEAGYALSSSLAEMDNEFMKDMGNESIIRLYASKSEGIVGCSLYTGVQSTDAEGKFFQPTFIPSQVIINAYNNSDLRKQAWFPVDMYPVKSQGTLYSGIAMFTKYIGNPTLQSGENEDCAHYCKPLMLSEMYLIAAEAYALAGDDAAAAGVLGELKTARKAGESEGDVLPARPAQAAAKDIVMSTPESDYTGRALAADAHTLVWPIPSYEIKISPALIQNPGYSAE